VLGIALGLAASVSWGISDFLGGLQARRFSALSVLVVSQPVGAVLAFGVAAVFGEDPLPASKFLVAAAGGAAVVLALGAFYRAMALGSVSVVATIGALGLLVPVAGGIAQGETPEGLQAVGGAVAVAAVVLVAREPDPEWRAANRASVGLAALAALGFGTFFLAIDDAAGNDPAWTIAAARAGGVTVLLALALALRPEPPCSRSAASTSSPTRCTPWPPPTACSPWSPLRRPSIRRSRCCWRGSCSASASPPCSAPASSWRWPASA
jgi:drug/metabolite transporter (DMT)-like permease